VLGGLTGRLQARRDLTRLNNWRDVGEDGEDRAAKFAGREPIFAPTLSDAFE
jgi:hypothetical protein